MADVPKPKLRWYQYSLRSLFLLTLVVAIGMSYVSVTIRGQRRQHDAAEAIRKAGGTADSYQTWLGRLLRDDSLVQVFMVGLSGESTTDGALVHLSGLNQLQALMIERATKVTDVGLVHLEGLSQLHCLILDDTQITDAGLVHLHGLAQLQLLSVCNTRVTDAGVRKLKQALPNCTVRRSRPHTPATR